MTPHCWKKIEHDRLKYPGIHAELWTHGTVYSLVKKGLLSDTPLHCYASHSHSRASVLMQFGAGSVICNAHDTELERLDRANRVAPLLAAQDITPETLTAASIERTTPMPTQDALFRHLSRFVAFYFRH
jgi:hypothetical protein